MPELDKIFSLARLYLKQRCLICNKALLTSRAVSTPMWFRARASSGRLITSVYILVEWVTHLHIWVFIKTLLHELKMRKEREKRERTLTIATGYPGVETFPTPSPPRLFISEREVGVGKARKKGWGKSESKPGFEPQAYQPLDNINERKKNWWKRYKVPATMNGFRGRSAKWC